MVRISSDDPNSLIVSWTQPPSGNCDIVTNTIMWRVSGSVTDTGQDEVPATTNYIITGLETCTEYEVFVSAATEAGHGPQGADRGTTGVEGKWLLQW